MDIKAYIESGVIESYVLGLAGTDEVAELEMLAMLHPEIRQAIDDFAQLIQQQVLQEPAAVPPASVKEQLMLTLANEFAKEDGDNAAQIPTPQIAAANPTTGKVVKLPVYTAWKNVAAAAVILFVVSAALNVYYYNNYTQTSNKYQALLAERNTLQASNNEYHQTLNIINDSAMRVVRMPGVPGKQDNVATVYWDTKTKDVYVYANTLQQAPQGKQYQLWALVNGQPVDAGIIGDCNGVCKMKNIPNAQAFAITLEKEGGSKTPDLKAMYVFGKV